MNSISRDARKLIIDDLVSIGCCAGGQSVTDFSKTVCPNIECKTCQQGSRTKLVINEIAKHMDYNEDWDFNHLFEQTLDLLNVSDKDFIYFCEQYVNPMFRRYRENDNKERIDISQECINTINQGLSDIDLSLQPRGQVAGRTTYKVLPIKQGIQEPIKNIIFAAKNKPDIALGDALANDITVIDAKGALIYDQGIPHDGISWEALANWYVSLNVKNTYEQMVNLFQNSLDSNPERLFYNAYISYVTKHGKRIPALIPQVYMYYDPKTNNQRGWKLFEHQKMDFMMIISPSQRIVIEIDGYQHYAEDETVLGTLYKHYASPTRYAEMMKAHREMSLAGYDVYRFGGHELWVNEHNSEEQIINNMYEFFDKLLKKYNIDR